MERVAVCPRRRNQKSTAPATRVKIPIVHSHTRRSFNCQEKPFSFPPERFSPLGQSLRRKFQNASQVRCISSPIFASSLSNQLGGLGCSASCQRYIVRCDSTSNAW